MGCFDTNSIDEFIKLQEELHYEIIIPKVIVAIENTNDAVAWQYIEVAYAGHLFNQLAASFAYLVPHAGKKDYFQFEVEIHDSLKLADLLYMIIQVFYANPETDEIRNFTNQAYAFFEQSFKTEPKPATWGLICVADEYLE